MIIIVMWTSLLVYDICILLYVKLIHYGFILFLFGQVLASDILVIQFINVRQSYFARYWYRMDVCPSVCPSHAGIVSKRLNCKDVVCSPIFH